MKFSKGRKFSIKGLLLACFSIAATGLDAAVEIPPRLLAELASEDFRRREGAESELLKWARERREPALDQLLAQSRKADDPEVRQRCLDVLRQVVIDDYLKEGQGFLGISMDEVVVPVPGDPGPRHVIHIRAVVPNSPAALVKLQQGDLIVALQDEVWRAPGALQVFMGKIAGEKPTSRVTLSILRKDELFKVTVALGRRPPGDPRGMAETEAYDRAAKEAYFRDWLRKKNARQ